MATTIPDDFTGLLEGPVFVTLVTLMPDNQPQASVVWCTYEDGRIWVNTARGRQKDRNMTARPRVTVLALDPDNPYRYLEVRGEVDEVTEEGALDHINQLSKLYTGNDDYYAANPSQRGKQTRVIYKIKPTHVVARD